MTQKIIKTKKCESCKQPILMKEQISYVGKWKNKFTKLVELDHYCDGGESYFCNKMDAERAYWNKALLRENDPYQGFA